MTRKEDILDAMPGAHWFSTMALMSVYYQVRMCAEDIKFTTFQAPNGFWEYLVLPMGVCNAPATKHRLTSKLFRNLEDTKSFYDDIYTKSAKIEDHLEALRETLDILRDNKLYRSYRALEILWDAKEFVWNRTKCRQSKTGQYHVHKRSFTTFSKNKRNAKIQFSNDYAIHHLPFSVLAQANSLWEESCSKWSTVLSTHRIYQS
ncbi:hypothetical protein PHMEG_00023434, partial [Phytophthora megakarya]